MNIIKNYPFVDLEGDLNHSPHGIVYQKDMTQLIEYSTNYFKNYQSLKNSEIANKINEVRKTMTQQYCSCLIDIGIGSGEFIEKSDIQVYGYDINKHGIEWLKTRNIYINPFQGIPSEIDGWTFWDVIEHLPEPQELLDLVPLNHYLFTSIPIFENISKVKTSKHFKPNEHLYYFTRQGFITFMTDSGFKLIEENDLETRAGREGITNFSFIKAKCNQC